MSNNNANFNSNFMYHPNAFKVCRTPRQTPDSVNNVTSIPKEQDSVYSDYNGKIILGREIGCGGEGVVYETNLAYVAKIYHANKNTSYRQEKVNKLVHHHLSCQGVCAPLDTLYNVKHEFVGCLMPKASGVPLSTIAIRPRFASFFPGWKRPQLVELSITILDKMINLHKSGIILGDINPNNILVKSSTEVDIIDADSFQIEDLPCPVGTLSFTAPELQKFNSFKDILRNPANEEFSIAVLLFYILLLGQFPYHQKGNATEKENIKNMAFPYPLGPVKNGEPPDGLWRFMWSMLPADVKKAFYHTFAKGGEFSRMQNRLSAEDWKILMQKYRHLLDSGKFGAQDPMSEEIYPTRFKKQKDTVIVHCTCCGNEADAKYCDQNGVCMECRRKQGIVNGTTRPTSRPFNPLRRQGFRTASDSLNKLRRINY